MIMKEELVSNEVERNSFVVPFLIGGLVGAGIMLLLAPKSGKEIRRDIGDLAADTRERLTSTIDKAKLAYEEGKSAIADAIDAGKTAYIREKEKHSQAA
jgi:gas vesicle protein